MKLYIDIGNSRTKLVEYEDGYGEVRSVLSDADTLESAFSALIDDMKKPEQVFISNVGGKKIADIVSEVFDEKFSLVPQFLEVSREFGKVRNGYSQYQQLGADRWAAIVAAWNKFKSNLLVVDCGSAVTLDVVQDSGEHLGGYIIPGKHMMMQALTQNTAEILFENTDTYSGIPGRTTAQCISNAAHDTILSFIEYKFNFLSNNSNKSFQCIITGGGAGEITGRLSISYIYEPLLVFDGMKIISGARS